MQGVQVLPVMSLMNVCFSSDVDEAFTAHTMFMANLSSTDLIYDEAGLSYESYILSEVHDHDYYEDDVYEHYEAHEMHHDVQSNRVLAQCVFVNKQNKVVNASLTAKLATYKEQVELYERRAKFELTQRERKIKEQLRIVITDCNIKEEYLKKELHSIKMQLSSTINHNKSMVEECVKKKVKIAPHDYSKENYLVTFTPQKQLTPEQIFWSKDLIKMKAEALKEQTIASRPIKSLTMALDFQITQLTEKVTVLQEQNELFRAENAKIKQHYKELYDSIKIKRAKHIEQTTSLLTENENLKAQIHENLKCITMDSVKPRVIAPGRYDIDVEPIPPHNRNNKEVQLDYLKHLKESVETLCEIVEEAKVEKSLDKSLTSACLYTKHSQLLEYVIGTCPKDFNQRDKNCAATPLTRKKQVTFEDQCETSNSNTQKRVEQLYIQKTNVFVPPSTEVNSYTDASGSQPRSNTKKNRILPAKSVNKKQVEEHPRTNKSSLKTTNRVDSSISSKHTVVQIVLWYLDAACSKHMMGDCSQLRNFVKKFIGTVRFGNDHFGAIMGYGYYMIGDSVISRVYYMEGLGHNLFSVGQFYDSNLEVAFRKRSCYVCDTDGVELIKGSRGSNLYTISVEDMMKSSPICLLSKASKNKSWFTWVKFLRSKDETPEFVINFIKKIQVGLNKTVRYIRIDNGTKFINQILTKYYERVGIFLQKIVPRTPQQNGVVKRQNRTLVEADRIMLIFSKALMFLWAEVVATACYTQNRSLIHTHHKKTPYELLHDKKPDLTFFQVIGALYYPTNDSDDLGKLQPITDIGIFVGYAPSRKGPTPTFLMPGQISSGLVPNPVPAAPYVPPTNKELEILFQPMFDEYLETPRVERPVSPAPIVPVKVNSAGTPSSTTIDQDAPSPSHSPSSLALQSPSSHKGVTAGSTIFEDNHFAPIDNNPFVNVFALEPSSEASSSGDVSSADSTHVSQPHHHIGK
ncbi:integrase, catalytic region, zinc finger, CCHC-type containing protein [Tanacetum coccineum]